MIGKVKMWHEGRAFGFIEPSDGTDDVFIHASELVDAKSLEIGDRVEYTLEDHPKGPRALKVMRSGGKLKAEDIWKNN
jgi:CspA family cold shock protein